MLSEIKSIDIELMFLQKITQIVVAQRIVFAEHPLKGTRDAGAGVDSAWAQKKLEARKMPGNGAESPASRTRFVGRFFAIRESLT